MNSAIKRYCRGLIEKTKYGISEEECILGIFSACSFFRIPMPLFVRNLTSDPQGQTMFINSNRQSYVDDTLCYNLEQLKELGVNNYIGFTAVFTHECAHRYFQNRLLPGPDFGQWEGELVADYFMGVRASLEHMDISSVIEGLSRTRGSGTHPPGKLRKDYIIYGMQEGHSHQTQNKPFEIEEYYQCFLRYLLQHLDELRMAELTVY